jgi:dolichol-phosphate mannosyltransferase
MNILCIIPAYNEKGNLQELVKQLRSEFRRQHLTYTIRFIIQGDDGSVEILDHLNQSRDDIEYNYFAQPLGIGNAYRRGFESIPKKYTHILTMDADLNHAPSEFNKFLLCFHSTKPDVIIGSRFIPGGSFHDRRIWKRVISVGMNAFITALTGIKVHDISSGYRLIKREVIDDIGRSLQQPGYPSYMEFMLLAHKRGYTVAEVPINYIPRIWGKSKMKTLDTMIQYLKFLIAFRSIS